MPFPEISRYLAPEPAHLGEAQLSPELPAELERLAARARALNASPEALSLARAVLLALSVARNTAA